MSKPTLTKIGLGLASLGVLAVLAFQLPPVNQRLAWRVDVARTYLRGMLSPAGDVPTPLPQPAVEITLAPTPTAEPLLMDEPLMDEPLMDEPPTVIPTLTPTLAVSPTPTLTPTPLPASVSLPSPSWEEQTPNNCGPASLSMYLRYYGWEGDQAAVAELLKPLTEDRNVNVEELVFFARTRAGWLNTEYRVGGDIELMKKFLAAGIPVLIEEGMALDQTYWPDDDRWAGHYLLLTGYDDASQAFTAQDTYYGADQVATFARVQENWQAFNYVYILIYRPEQAGTVQAILGEQWDADANREYALSLAQAEAEAGPENPFPWFNIGSNLVYFERYREASEAYDTARNLGLPQRMLRYQFGPFFAYFFGTRNEDLLTLAEYALKITPNSEEALLWRGWGRYRAGSRNEAVADFQAALQHNPLYQDAQYALDFIATNP
jgi:hypothetical protein